jgi:hypothetical protein
MDNSFLSQIEKNIEVQAAGILAFKREDRALSEARGELAQILLSDRLRAKVNENISLDINRIGTVNGIVKQVFSDHLLLITNSKIWLIDLLHIKILSRLDRSVKKPNPIEVNWSKISTLRDWMIDLANVTFYTSDGEILSGTMHKLYKDHLDIKTASEIITIYYHLIIAGQRSHEN